MTLPRQPRDPPVGVSPDGQRVPLLTPEAEGIWRQVVAQHPEASADALTLANYCAATARARRVAAGDRSARACHYVRQQRALADLLGFTGAMKEPTRQMTPRQMVRVRAIGRGVPEGSSYVANDGSDVEVALVPGEEADITDACARTWVRLGLVEMA